MDMSKDKIEKMIEYGYKEILTDNNLSVKEKLEKIEENFNNIKSENKTAYIESKSTLLSEYKECPLCKDYYKKEFFNTSIGKELVQVCTNPFDGYLDKYEYKMEEVLFEYGICPKGHKFKIGKLY